MGRRAARVDSNHGEIVHALVQANCSVQSLASLGKGCPDLLVGLRGQNHLLEIKDGSKPPSARHLTQDQSKWIALWRGRVTVVTSPREALEAVGISCVNTSNGVS